MNDAVPEVTVVIPARDAATTLGAQLDALAAQDYPRPLVVVVADNGSTDDTAARAAAWRDRFGELRVVDASDRPGAAHARNVGTRAAGTELVLCCDADDVADPGWVRHLVAALAGADAVAGGTASFHGPEPASLPAPVAFGTAGFGFLPGMPGASCGYHRAAWASVGGFAEELAAGGEDLDFAWRLQLAGLTLAQAPEGFVRYREPAAAGALLRRWYHYGRVQPLLLRRFRASGMRPDRTARVLAAWVGLLLDVPRLLTGGEARRRWCREAGRRTGRLAGSVRFRAWYP